MEQTGLRQNRYRCRRGHSRPGRRPTYLYHRWPYTQDDLCELAQCDCLKAIQKELPCDKARDAFVNAAVRAGMLA
ncbi:DUF982 domain-containing protein [Agrobacterium rosae]